MDINQESIMQNMIDKNESCRIIQNGDETIVKLRPISILDSLKGKLSDADIQSGGSIVNRQLTINALKTNLYRQCINTHCNYQNQSMFRAVPSGNGEAKVMFINKQPTQYEACNMSTHCDREGTFLSLILSKMNVSRDSIYCTDMIKCHGNPDENSCKECINQYLEQEINFVKPQIIICNGMAVLNACIKMSVLSNLPENVSYGMIYDATTSLGRNIKVMAMYDLNKVLQKSDTDYAKCKDELWSQILTAFKTTV